MPKVNLNKAFLKDCLICPEGKTRTEFVCNRTAGFFLEVSGKSPGVGTYYVRYRDINCKPKTVKLGRTDDTGLDVAREKAVSIREQASQGKDPLADLPRNKPKPIFGDFFTEQYLPHAKIHKRTWDNDLHMFNAALKKEFGGERIDCIKRYQVESFHRKLRESGKSPATCDHYAKLMRHVLNLAVEWELLEANPLVRIKLFREDNRLERYMDDEALSGLLDTLHNHYNRPICEMVLFLLSTGARRGEAMLAEWKHMDMDTKVWRIPSKISKSKRIRSVPLNDAALDVLGTIQGRYDSEYIFLNPRTKKPYVNITKPWNTIRMAAGLPKLRLHDLRHQHASMLVNAGRSLYEVQQILGHANSSVTERYAHLSKASLQQASDTVSDELKALKSELEPAGPALKLVHSK